MQIDRQWEKVSSFEKLDGFMSIKIKRGNWNSRYFQEVNTTLLAKIGWFLVSKPDRLWAQNFKAKYGSSNAWLEMERPRMLHGFEGELKVQMHYWKAKMFFSWEWGCMEWSKGPTFTYIKWANHSLIVSQSKWAGKMEQKQATTVFDEYSIRAVKQIPISKRATPGKLVRLGEKSRNFSMKSAYLTD